MSLLIARPKEGGILVVMLQPLHGKDTSNQSQLGESESQAELEAGRLAGNWTWESATGAYDIAQPLHVLDSWPVCNLQRAPSWHPTALRAQVTSEMSVLIA